MRWSRLCDVRHRLNSTEVWKKAATNGVSSRFGHAGLLRDRARRRNQPSRPRRRGAKPGFLIRRRHLRHPLNRNSAMHYRSSGSLCTLGRSPCQAQQAVSQGAPAPFCSCSVLLELLHTGTRCSVTIRLLHAGRRRLWPSIKPHPLKLWNS